MPLTIRLPADTKLPLHRQIFNAIRQEIVEGRLSPGEKLPSSRELADRLGVSRDSVSRSYTELASQGYLVIRPASGAVVNAELGMRKHVNTASREARSAISTAGGEAVSAELSEYGKRILEAPGLEKPAAYVYPELNFHAPLLDELPVRRWQDMVKRAANYQDPSLVSYVNDPFGYRPLREAIAGYLSRWRFIDCSPDNIAIFTTTEGGTDTICRLVLSEGDGVAVENPGSAEVRLSFNVHGAKLYPVSVDKDGLSVRELVQAGESIKLAYVTPSHHDPTGVIMAEERRRELLRWAVASGAFIIEDDFDSEYRYGQKPVPALKAMDRQGVVIYRYNFWRVLFPLARIAFMVLPEALANAVWRTKTLTERDVPFLEQKALAAFINEGHLEMHIKRSKALYAKRRAALVQALVRNLGKQIEISPVSAGMHLMIRFAEEVAEEAVVQASHESGLPLASMRDRYVGEPPHAQFLISFAHRHESEFAELVTRFAELLRRAGTVAPA